MSSVEKELSADGLALIGPSGTGKSALLRGLVEARLDEDADALWFDAGSFARTDYMNLEASLQLKCPLREFAQRVLSPMPVVVIDGLDREFDEKTFKVAAALLANFAAPWRAIVPCQSEQWERVQLALINGGVNAAGWGIVQCEPLGSDERAIVVDRVPQVALLLNDQRLAPILSNLKILDLIVGKLLVGEKVASAGWVGESSVALWYWQSYIRKGPQAAMRARLATRVAERQGEPRNELLRESDLNGDELSVLVELEADRVLRRVAGGGVAFQHDLLGDWVRFYSIVSREAELQNFVSGLRSRPLWHRALRIYGVYLLEHQNSMASWDAARAGLSDALGESTGDLLLEAVLYATNPAPLLVAIQPALLRDDGLLLKRLLTRFLSFCTVPDPRMVALAQVANVDRDYVEARYRIPSDAYWHPVLEFICSNAATLLPLAPAELSRVAELWLRHRPPTPLRARVAALAVALGTHGLDVQDSYRTKLERRLGYRAALLAAADEPELATRFVLRAANRDRPVDERLLADVPTGFDAEADVVYWPDGPYARVDDVFREVVLDPASFAPLAAALPSIAREVALAVLIEGPHRRPQFDPVDRDYGLVDPAWRSSTFVDGPFLVLLREHFVEGLELVARLVEHATQQMREHDQMRFEMRGWYGPPPAPDEPTPEVLWDREAVHIEVDGKVSRFVGGERAYGWTVLGSSPDYVNNGWIKRAA